MRNAKLFITISAVVVIVSVLSFTSLYALQRFQKIESRLETIGSGRIDTSSETGDGNTTLLEDDDCGKNCQIVVADMIARAISTISGTPKISQKTVIPTKTPSTTYIPMGTTYTTTSTDWYTINDTAVYVDLDSEYGTNATASWEASIKIAHGNGQVFIRLWDDTNKIAVNGSELTSINNVNYQLVSSGNLPFWNGRNLYKVQIKSLNSFEATITGGKIKIMY